tara:strand:- start:10 stop:147 length:138 start_codon:yes stop_codon:yes gene_type:complete
MDCQKKSFFSRITTIPDSHHHHINPMMKSDVYEQQHKTPHKPSEE